MKINELQTFQKNKKAIFVGASFLAIALTLAFIKKRKGNKNHRKLTYIKKLTNLTRLLELPFEPTYRIHISDPQLLIHKLIKMKKDGLRHLNIIADYDLTITSFRLNGSENYTAYQIIVKNQISSENFRVQSHAYDNFYRPLEKDMTIPFNQKKELMSEWYKKINDLIISEQFTSETLGKILADVDIGIRYHFKSFYYKLTSLGVPFYIISGGIADYVSTVLENYCGFHSIPANHIFSNAFVFDENGVMIDMQKEINTTTKKSILHDMKIPYRRNSIVLGDLPGDTSMAQNIYALSVINIGFLHDVSELSAYKSLFDVVIEGEGDFILADIFAHYIGDLHGEAIDLAKVNPCYNEIVSLLNL